MIAYLKVDEVYQNWWVQINENEVHLKCDWLKQMVQNGNEFIRDC